jgi:hypothetical protein
LINFLKRIYMLNYKSLFNVIQYFIRNIHFAEQRNLFEIPQSLKCGSPNWEQVSEKKTERKPPAQGVSCFICPSQDNSAPPLDPSSLPDHIGTIPTSTEALQRAELHPLDILPHSHAIPLSFFHIEPPTHCH